MFGIAIKTIFDILFCKVSKSQNLINVTLLYVKKQKMEERVAEVLRNAGINAPDDIIAAFCKSLEENKESPVKKEKPKKKSTKKKKPRKLGPSQNMPNEMDMWEEKVSNWEKKVEALDLQLATCSEIHESYSSNYIEDPYDEKNDPLSAYPVLKHGPREFIHPPEVIKPIRRRFPIYKSEIHSLAPNFIQELRENERTRHPYVPGNENRQDELRWRIKERILYSHPDYYLRGRK